MQTQHNFARVLREIETGREVGITRHKKLVARLLPPAETVPVVFPDFVTRARRVWKKGWSGASSRALLDETRGNR